MAGQTRVLGRGGVFINALGLMLFVFGLAMAVVAAAQPIEVADEVANAAGLGVIAAFGMLAATTWVGLRAGDLVLVRLLTVTTVPLTAVVRVSGEDGLEVETGEGQTLTHIGYGSSLIGAFTGDRRASRVAIRIRQSLPLGEPASGQIHVTRRRPRPALALFVVLPVACVLVGALS